jgi:Arc/MetJ-type ribon-helix-helix transcriptional regulator
LFYIAKESLTALWGSGRFESRSGFVRASVFNGLNENEAVAAVSHCQTEPSSRPKVDSALAPAVHRPAARKIIVPVYVSCTENLSILLSEKRSGQLESCL